MKTSKLALGAIIGAAVGIAAGVLTAPKSGKETRDDLKRKATEAKDKAATTRDDLVFKAEEVADDVRVKATETIETVKSSLRK
ncbi:MAG: YtxH domain-containing protein [Patescibacteria group bacterium]